MKLYKLSLILFLFNISNANSINDKAVKDQIYFNLNSFEKTTKQEAPSFHKSIEKSPYRITNNDEWSKPSRNLIEKIRKKFFLEIELNNRITSEIKFITRNKDYMDKVLTRSAFFLPYIVNELNRRNMPIELALLPIVESAYDPFAYSYGQAAGLWQIIPITADRFGLDQNWWFDGRRDVIYSTQAALDYLEYLYKYIGDDWLLALAAYNAGEGTVSRAIKKNKSESKSSDFWNLELSSQTSAYVPRLLALVEIIKNNDKYDVNLPYISNDQYFEVIDIKSQIDLSIAAELAEIDLNELYTLNAGFNRWATSPDGPNRLLIPKNKANDFKDALKALPETQMVSWKRHSVKYGETLSEIAANYSTTTKQIKLANELTSNIIRTDDYLMIPVSYMSARSYTKSDKQRRINTQNKSRKGKRIEHSIKRGESLWLLSRRYNVKINSLASWNGISPKDILPIGEKLIIWTEESIAKPKMISKKLNYIVKNGDSLYLIAKKFRVTIVEIARWNNLDQSKILKPGQKLALHVDVRNQSS